MKEFPGNNNKIYGEFHELRFWVKAIPCSSQSHHHNLETGSKGTQEKLLGSLRNDELEEKRQSTTSSSCLKIERRGLLTTKLKGLCKGLGTVKLMLFLVQIPSSARRGQMARASPALATKTDPPASNQQMQSLEALKQTSFFVTFFEPGLVWLDATALTEDQRSLKSRTPFQN